MNARSTLLTDTHTHIYYLHGTPSLDEHVQRCLTNNIQRLFLPNVDLDSIDKVFNTVAAYPDICYPMLGLHPCHVSKDVESELQAIYSVIRKHHTNIYAVGEIGIDMHWDKSTLPYQQHAFRTQIEWAKELGLPIVIHCREAFDEVFDLLDEVNDNRLFGIFHCFTGNIEQARHAIDLGFWLGIGGVVTYKNAGLDKVVQQIDLKHIVLETDAPYLAPVPYRGKKNESSYLLHIAQKVADLHGISLEAVATTTTANSKAIFGV